MKFHKSYFRMFWTPAFAGVTIKETFYDSILFDWRQAPIARRAAASPPSLHP
jgi:hypothetical protein